MLAIGQPGDASPRSLAALSRSWDAAPGARLVVAIPTDTATVLGAFDRRRDEASVVRGSGGAPVTVGPGTVWVQLALARPDVLVPGCRIDQLLNRYVRPLLRAVSRVSRAPATYFGRDWIAVGGAPVGLVSFAHDRATDRCLFEAFLAAETPFSGPRASFRGKEPATLGADPARLAALVAQAYGPGEAVPVAAASEEPPLAAAFAVTLEEALGVIGADANAIGGELVASRDAVAEVNARLRAGAPIAAALEAFAGAQLFGARLESLAEAVRRARYLARLDAATALLTSAGLRWDALAPDDRACAALFKVEADLTNGGYLQFFCNWGPAAHVHAAEALARIAATEHAALLERAYAVIARYEDDPRLTTLCDLARLLTQEEWAHLGALDEAWWRSSEDLVGLGAAHFAEP